MTSGNFGALLAERCHPQSSLIDAVQGESIGGPGLEDAIARAAALFRRDDLRPGDRVLLLCRPTPTTALAYLGALYAGVVAVPIDDTAVKTGVDEFAALTGARAVWGEHLAKIEHVLPDNLIRLPADPLAMAPVDGPSDAAPDDLAVLMATSGSTSQPRFVMVSHQNLLANTVDIVASQQLVGADRAMLILPTSYCFGASVLHSHLWVGGSVVFDRRFMFPDKVLHAINEHRCTTFAGVPSTYQILLRRSHLAGIELPTLRRLLQAGGPLAQEAIAAIRQAVPASDFYVMYGQTEATARLTCLPPKALADKLGSVGLPLRSLEISIRDAHGRVLGSNQSGRIFVRGPSIGAGYWDDLEATAQVFGDGWLDTRDIGRLDGDGFLWLEGREGDFVKVRGRRLSFAEIEARVRRVSGVVEVAACGVPHPEAGEAPAVVFVPESGIDPEQLRAQIRQGLPPAWTCQRVLAVERLPLTARNKLDRKALTQIAEDIVRGS